MSRKSATRLFVPLAVLVCLGGCGAAHAIAFGSVQATILPEAAAAAAQWRVDGGAWQNSGATVEVTTGMHTVSFLPISGWRTPASQTIQVVYDTTTFVTGTYLSYSLCEGVGACNRAFEVWNGPFGGGSWFVQESVNHDGHNALQSGAVGPDQMTVIRTWVDGPCIISFWWRASCAPVTGQYWYSVDDNRMPTTLSGETGWIPETVPLGEGPHRIDWYFFRGAGDPGGGMNCGWLDQFLVTEAVPPTGSVTVNNGAASTGSPAATLGQTYADAGAGVTGMRFSNNGSTWSAWEKPAAQKAWTLSSGDGVKTVRAQFRDKAGNVSAVCTDTILLDQTPPTGSILINGGASTVNSLDVTLNLSWDDGAGSGVSRMRFSDNGSTWSPWEAVSATKAWTLPGWGYRTVRVQFLDRMGSVSAVYNDYIKAVAP